MFDCEHDWIEAHQSGRKYCSQCSITREEYLLEENPKLEARVRELKTRLQDLDNEMENAFHSVGWYLKQHGADGYGEYDIHEVAYNNSEYEDPTYSEYACAFIKICEQLRVEVINDE
jgi:hypothetical protein